MCRCSDSSKGEKVVYCLRGLRRSLVSEETGKKGMIFRGDQINFIDVGKRRAAFGLSELKRPCTKGGPQPGRAREIEGEDSNGSCGFGREDQNLVWAEK